MLYSGINGSFKEENRYKKVFKVVMFYNLIVKSMSVSAVDVVWHATVDRL